MGKGAVRDDHPLVMGMTGFWGTELVNQACLNADLVFAVGTRFKEADCSSWYPGYTFNIGAKGNDQRSFTSTSNRRKSGETIRRKSV